MGAKVALIERHLLGGDCLNFACVPSKVLLGVARKAQGIRYAEHFGISAVSPVVDFPKVMTRMRKIRSELSHHDSAQRLKEMGVDVYLGHATFQSAKEIMVNETQLSFSRAVIATGAKARTVPIPGLAEVGFLTNETVFSLTEIPRRLVVVGAGPIGCELAQAFSRLGSNVTIIGRDSTMLPQEDTDAAAVLTKQFSSEKIAYLFDTEIEYVYQNEAGEKVITCKGSTTSEIVADKILLAIGRIPNIKDLNLEAAGVRYSPSGVIVSDKMRTSNKRIYAAGDVCSRYQFTHAADAMARIVIQNALFFGRKKASALTIPWCTYTSPEIAHVGVSQNEARAKGLTTFTIDLSTMDRVILDGDTEGFARIHVDSKGRILGATLVASHAGELIGEMSLAITNDLRLRHLASTIHPYPTQSEVWKRLGDQWNRTRFTPLAQWLAKKWLSWIR